VIVETVEKLIDYQRAGVYNCGCTGTYTMLEIARSIGCGGLKIQERELHDSQGLYLVNNVMSMEKLIGATGYTPPDTLDEIIRCNEELKIKQFGS
jgi:nucleoside-diphosphate-sugar epimerase